MFFILLIHKQITWNRWCESWFEFINEECEGAAFSLMKNVCTAVCRCLFVQNLFMKFCVLVWLSRDCEKSHNCMGLLPQTAVCSQPSSPLNASGLLSEVIYYIIRGNGALCHLSPHHFGFTMALCTQHCLSCHSVTVCCVCVLRVGSRHTAHPKPTRPSPPPAKPPQPPSILRKKLMFTQFWPKWRPVTPPAAVGGAAAATHIFSALSADGWSGAGGWGCIGASRGWWWNAEVWVTDMWCLHLSSQPGVSAEPQGEGEMRERRRGN